ncbi:PQQ-binding-like beta-propeller repeat protein [Nocardiopsis sp. NPDC006198]|uniref:outer membrane protein assembly factor BamB family protein n=1 Tax=Nocardiopsis sp. NPDC006198 TaxID=3154472 RepID=UPI0033B8A46A
MKTFTPRACTAVVLLAALLLSVACSDSSILGNGVSHVTAEREVQEPPPVESVSRAAWEWAVPEGHSIRSVEASPVGPLLSLNAGVVGLDGVSGEEVWHYLAPEEERFVSQVMNDGSAVLVSHGAEDAETPSRVLLLDARSGEVLTEFEPVPHDWNPGFTNGEARAFVTGPEDLVSVAGLDDGEELWRQPEQLTCEREPDADITHQGVYGMYESVVVTVANCTGATEIAAQVVAGLDARTGEELWRWETENERLHMFTFAGDHVAVALPSGGDLAVINVLDGAVIQETDVNLLHLREDGYLVRVADAEQEDDLFEFRRFDGEGAQSVTFQDQNAMAVFGEDENVALADGVVSVQSRLGGYDLTELSVAFTPWGSDEFTVLESGFPAGPTGLEYPEEIPRVSHVPGAVVLLDAERPSQEIIAYQ